MLKWFAGLEHLKPMLAARKPSEQVKLEPLVLLAKVIPLLETDHDPILKMSLMLLHIVTISLRLMILLI